MNEKQRDRIVCSLAREFLLSLDTTTITELTLEKYLQPATRNHATSLPELYRAILESAQNANMKTGVIGRAIGGIAKLGNVLVGFDPNAVIAKYQSAQDVFDEIKNELKPTGKMRHTSRSIWPQYCRTILSSAKFLNQFSSAEEFYTWVQFFDKDNRARVALPMLLAQEIDGFGFALACDFLKELGYVNFGKPDVHIRNIFKSMELCPPKANDYHLFKSVIRVATNADITPYAADKLFWLIGSGYFYDDPQIGKNGRIGSRREKFIAFARHRLLLLKKRAMQN